MAKPWWDTLFRLKRQDCVCVYVREEIDRVCVCGVTTGPGALDIQETEKDTKTGTRKFNSRKRHPSSESTTEKVITSSSQKMNNEQERLVTRFLNIDNNLNVNI